MLKCLNGPNIKESYLFIAQANPQFSRYLRTLQQYNVQRGPIDAASAYGRSVTAVKLSEQAMRMLKSRATASLNRLPLSS